MNILNQRTTSYRTSTTIFLNAALSLPCETQTRIFANIIIDICVVRTHSVSAKGDIRAVCAFFTLNRSFHPLTSNTTSVRANSSILEIYNTW